MSTTTTTTTTLPKTKSSSFSDKAGPLKVAPEVPPTQPTPTCEAPIPLPHESAPGTICCHLNWQQDCPECHDSQLSKVAHLTEVSPQYPVLYLPENCPPSVKPKVGEMPQDNANAPVETASSSDTGSSLSSVSLGTGSTSNSEPSIVCPQSVHQAAHFPSQPLPVRPSSPDNLKDSTEMLQGLRIVEGNLQELEAPRSSSHNDIVPPNDIIPEPLPLKSSSSTESHTGLTLSDDGQFLTPDNSLERANMSSSSLGGLAGDEARRALADAHLGSILVQQFSSGDSPACTIILDRREEEEGGHHHHHHHRRHGHHHHNHHHRHRSRSSSSSSSRSRSRFRSRSRSRSRPPAPIVIVPGSPSSQRIPHYGYSETYPHRAAIEPRYPSCYGSPTIIRLPSPPGVRIPHPSSDAERTRSSSPKTISPVLTPPQVLSPLPTVIGRNEVPTSVVVRDSRDTSHSDLSLYRPLSPSFVRHEKFYFEDGSVVFRIGIVLYKVHRHFFDLHSVFFHELFTTYKLNERFTTPSPIVLADVKNEDFERLLTLFYPTKYTETDLTTVEEWTSIFILATNWVFSDLRALAIKHLTPSLPALDQVVLGLKYDSREWVAQGIKYLVTREDPLSVKEGEMLGSEVVVKIGQLRSELGNVYGDESVGDGDERRADFVDLRVKEVFDL